MFVKICCKFFRHISPTLCAFQLIPMMNVSCLQVKPASSGMRSVSLSSWHKGGSSSATTSSMWCLTSSLLRYWPLGQCFIFRFSSITYSSLKALHIRSVRFENLKVLYVLLDKSRLSVTLKK